MSAWLLAPLLVAQGLFGPLCAPCHGEGGRGDGPAAHLMWPPPRDLVAGTFRLGDDPASIRRTVARGVALSGMPAFGALPPAELDRLVAAVIALRGERVAARPPSPAAPDLAPLRARGDLLWRTAGCVPCHGAEGEGGAPLPSTAEGWPAHRVDLRRDPLKGGDGPAALFEALTYGRPGTPMPAFASLPARDRWALVARLRALRQPAASSPGPRPLSRPPAAPRTAPDPWWPPRGADLDASPVPALAQGDAAACGRCHPAEYAAWRQSRHALAMGPGVVGQTHAGLDLTAHGCDPCHAPAPRHRAEGVGCVTCHVRDHAKAGPPTPVTRRLPAVGLRARPVDRFARSDFCLPCHNQSAAAAVDGFPLLDTWREWAASPYLPAGVQCQHCHQPDGHHGFAGAHDPEAVRRGVRLDGQVEVRGAEVEVVARLHNVAVGHHFPTTATPRGVVRVRQRGPDGPLSGTEATWAIGRTVEVRDGRWRTVADTRVPAGATAERIYRWRRHPRAVAVEADLHLYPDWLYVGIYGRLIAAAGGDAPPLEAARIAARASGFRVTAWRARLP